MLTFYVTITSLLAVCLSVTASSLQYQDTKNADFLQRNEREYFIIEDRINKSIPPLDISQTVVDGEHRFPCFIRVGAFKNQISTEAVPNAEVTVLTRKLNESNDYAYYGYGNNYVGFSKTITGSDGMACAPTLCFHEALIFVVIEGERLTLASNETNFLPKGYFYITQTRNEEVAFGPRYMGTMYGKKGPVYREMNERECKESLSSNSWYFRFAYLSVPERLYAVENRTSQLLSWYPYSFKSRNFAVCFLKVTINTNQNNVMLNATSYDPQNRTYGYFISGPRADPTSKDTSIRAACLEYRCPINEPVVVDVRIERSICQYCSGTITPEIRHTDNTFQVRIEPGDRYGPANGIYIANGVESARTLAKDWCIAGRSYSESGFHSNPSLQPIVTYDCNITPPITG